MKDVSLIIIFAIVVVVGGIAVGSKYYFGLKDDNIVEEISEDVIREATGVDVDLSPSSPEVQTRQNPRKQKIGNV